MKNKLTRNNKLVTILLHLRRKKMECPTKSMSSYQRLKWEMDQLEADLAKAKEEIRQYKNVLWAIATMKGPEVVQAPRLALETLDKHETK